MKVKEAHMQAFPFIEPHSNDYIHVYHTGMELRDHFAAMAMQNMLEPFDRRSNENPDKLVAYSYVVADAMMKARKKC